MSPLFHTDTGDDELVDSVMAASRVIVGVAARSIAHAGADITLPQYRALVLLITRGPQSNGAFAELLAVNPSSATRIVERLRRAGLVHRTPVEGDRRSFIVTPTLKAHDLVAAAAECRRRELQRLLDAVPDEFHEAIIKGLYAIAEAAGEPDEPHLRASLRVPLIGWGK